MNTHQQHHIVPWTTYFIVYIVLMVLLVATVTAWYFHLGLLGILLGDMIGIVKATIIILYFMHVRYSSKMVWVIAVAGFVWLAILVGLTLSDYFSRGWLPLASPPLGG
jgi:cytochrome c oxidase subunit 4